MTAASHLAAESLSSSAAGLSSLVSVISSWSSIFGSRRGSWLCWSCAVPLMVGSSITTVLAEPLVAFSLVSTTSVSSAYWGLSCLESEKLIFELLMSWWASRGSNEPDLVVASSSSLSSLPATTSALLVLAVPFARSIFFLAWKSASLTWFCRRGYFNWPGGIATVKAVPSIETTYSQFSM